MSTVASKKVNPHSVSNSVHYLILFIVWPFLAFCIALTSYSQKEARRVVYFFLIYFGLTLVIHDKFYFDAAGYALDFQKNATLPFSDFFKIVGGLYNTDTSVDVFEPFVSFLVSRFTSDYRVLFAVYAAIFGFFYLKSIDLLYKGYLKNPGLNVSIHLAFFSIILPITAISGFRMWTAAWIFFYGAYHAVLYREIRFLILALLSSFVHWSFLTANVILLIYFFAGNRNYIYLPIALLSFVAPQLISPLFSAISLRLGGALQSRFDSYTSENYMLFRQGDMAEASWFLQIGNNLVFYYLLFALVVIQVEFRHLMNSKEEKNLFSFLLLFLALVNFGRSIPSFGGRFQIVFFLFATLYVYLFSIKISGNKLNITTIVGLFPMLLYAVVALRQASEFINAWLFAPGFGLPLLVPGLPLIDLL